jgi:hypothetical protein
MPETFKVEVGDVTKQSRVLTGSEDDVNLDRVMEVPMDFKDAFDKDPDGAARDHGGISVLSIRPFFGRRDLVSEMMQNAQALGLRHPFSDFSVTLQAEHERLLPEYLDWVTDPDGKKHLANGPYYAHIDLALKGDAAGLGIAHVTGSRQVTRGFGPDRKFETKPIVRVDLALEIVAPPRGEIRISSIRELLYMLRDLGMQFGIVSYDAWGSEESIQTLKNEGFYAELLSVDKDSAPYEATKECCYDGRLVCYYHPILAMEFATVRKDEKTGKIDHPSHGCFSGDTRIALADGTVPTFEELAERFKPEDEFAVYAMSPGGVQICMARNPRVTRSDGELLEVVLDNWHVVHCTPDHPFMLLDGTFVSACDLRELHRLMPLYRTSSQKGGWADYEHVWCPIQRRRILTHHVAAGAPAPGWIVHHKDENKRNNDPRNLEHAERGEHMRRHGIKRFETDSFFIQRFREGHKFYRETIGGKKSRQNILSLFDRGILKRGRSVCIVEGCSSLATTKGMCGVHYQRWRRAKLKQERAATQQNHRALSVRMIARRADVWDITVPGLENFALAAGVFVHNSKDVADGVAGAVWQAEKAWAGCATSQWSGIMTMQPEVHFGFEDDNAYLWGLVNRGVPLAEGQIAKLK